MKENSKALAYGAVSAALGTVILYLGSVLPSARLALLCISSLGVILMALRFDGRRALAVYAVTAALALLVLPGKAMALAYALLPGWYPLIKLRLERLKTPAARYAAKFLAANAVLLPAFLLGRSYFSAMPLPLWQILVAGEAVFLVYDYALTQIILLYMRKIAGRI